MESAICEKDQVKASAEKNHSINVQFTLPFLFRKFYVAFYSGVDRREQANEYPVQDRRTKMRMWDLAFMTSLFLCFSAFLGFVIHKFLGNLS